MSPRLVVPVLAALAIAGVAWAKKPVTKEGSTPPPPPPAVAPSAPAAEEKKDEPKAEEPEKKEPAGEQAKTPPPPKKEPPKPEFYGMPKPDESGPAAPKEEDPDPAELRFNKRSGDFAVEMTLRPGKPKPGQPVEVVFNVNEILRIPDPYLGDRKPLTKTRLVAELRGPDPTTTYEVHELVAKGDYGLHFTPMKEGLYALVVDRADGKKGVHFDFAVGVGVPTPAPVDRSGDPSVKAGVAAGKKPLFKPTFALDERARKPGQLNEAAKINGVMKELGKRWLALGRAAGKPEAAAALASVVEQAGQVKGNVPERHAKDGSAFDRFAGEAQKAVGALPASGDAAKLQAAMLEVQETQCLKCHAQFRYDFASDVFRWPDFTAAKARR